MFVALVVSVVADAAKATPFVLVQVIAPDETMAQSLESGTPTARLPAEPTMMKF